MEKWDLSGLSPKRNQYENINIKNSRWGEKYCEIDDYFRGRGKLFYSITYLGNNGLGS